MKAGTAQFMLAINRLELHSRGVFWGVPRWAVHVSRLASFLVRTVMACSLSFWRACTDSDHVLSVDGIDIPSHVYARSSLLRELLTDEHVDHGNVTLPLTSAAFLAWAHCKDSSSSLSIQDLFAIAQVRFHRFLLMSFALAFA